MIYVLCVICQGAVTLGIITEREWLTKLGLAGHLLVFGISVLMAMDGVMKIYAT